MIQKMVGELGYPKGLIVVEKELTTLYRNNLKNRFLTVSGLPQDSRSHSGLASRQWSLSPNANPEAPPCQNPDSSSCFGISDSNRRLDILCYAPGYDGLRPLLLIECKASRLDAQTEKQAFGYNDAIGAPFIALTNGTEIKTLWREPGKIASIPFLPRFTALVAKL
jgi:hypothetical protein